MKKAFLLIVSILLLFGTTFSSVFADDGVITSKSISHDNTLEVPEGYIAEAEHAFVAYMKFYTYAQTSDGIVSPIEYYDVDNGLVETRDFAKPLIGVNIYGPVEGVEEAGGFSGHGLREAYAAVSLDDGNTWKNVNLSESADKSSTDIAREDVPLFTLDGISTYPGDVTNIFLTVAGNNVLVAWQSRYCESGEPNFSLDTVDPSPDQIARRAAIAAYLGIDLAEASPDDLYLIDMYGVGGNQGSVDYALDKFEQNQPVGVVPFNCLWNTRGTLVNGDDPRTTDVVEKSFMRWYNAERLTSGVRDVNRIETQCVAGAGCAITWQEDPEGLRPGQGEGPGEGWSGATAASKTDAWYSFIDWEDFGVVQNPVDATGVTHMTLAEFEETAAAQDITQKPKVFVPFSMPMRLTDNAKCNYENPLPYCNGDAIKDLFPDVLVPMDYGLKDLCATTQMVQIGKDTIPSEVCFTEDGLPMLGNTAATRPRLGLYGYASSGDAVDSAFVQVILEEDKGLGKFGFTAEGIACDPDDETLEGCIAFDEGKNIWYHSFSMSLTDPLAADPLDGLLTNLSYHGDILNQPEVDWTTGEFYPIRNTAAMWNFVDDETGANYNFDIYGTEIARRGSLLAQEIQKANESNEKLITLATWKQGVMNQGGPADVMARRIAIPTGWNLTNGNPYAFRNMVCENWAYEDGSNPYYPQGICLDSAINISATIPDACYDTETNQPIACPQVDLSQGTSFGIGDTNPILQGLVQGEGNTQKVLSWHSCPADFETVTSTDGTVLYNCGNDLRTDGDTTRDQSWYNPLDVAKGHRGFLDGDFVMILYAWSPNWRLNAVGSDRYELYVRRSFNGADTWTTLPENFVASDGAQYSGDGTVTCETFRTDVTGTGDLLEPRVCNSYAAGANEQPRNVTQHQSMRITTLDPRYATTGSPYGVSVAADPFGTGYTFTNEDTRDPSRYFIVYETGDNQTTQLGEPEPLDLFYSRAINFGDDYVVWAEEGGLDVCYPSDPHDDIDPDTGVPTELIGSGLCNEFDQLEQGKPGLEASEASLQANPGGEFLYGAWAQIYHDPDLGQATESDAMVRRVWWLDDFVSSVNAWDFVQGVTIYLPMILQ